MGLYYPRQGCPELAMGSKGAEGRLWKKSNVHVSAMETMAKMIIVLVKFAIKLKAHSHEWPSRIVCFKGSPYVLQRPVENKMVYHPVRTGEPWRFASDSLRPRVRSLVFVYLAVLVMGIVAGFVLDGAYHVIDSVSNYETVQNGLYTFQNK